MIQIQNVTLTLNQSLRTLVAGLTVSLGDGDKAAVIGEEGNGKSTLLKAVCDPSLIAGYASMQGAVRLGGHLPGYVAQEMPADLLNRPVSSLFAGFHPSDGAEAAAEVGLHSNILTSERPIRTFSGGEKVKLQIARLLLSGADFLLLDEPTNDLDIETLEWLERFIVRFDGPILYISHDETLLERTANLILHIEQIRKKTVPRCSVIRAGYADYIARRAAALSHQEQTARKEQADFDRRTQRWDEIFRQVEKAQRTVARADPGSGRLLKKKMHTVQSQKRRFEREKEQMTPMPDVEDAIFLAFSETISLPAGKRVLDESIPTLSAGGRVLAENVQLHLSGGEHIAIVGRNGAGKTTLLRSIAQSLCARPDLHAAYMPQHYAERLDLSETPVDFLAPSGRKDDVTRVRSFLGNAKFTRDEMCGPIGALSGGQRAKLFFLKMVLDESDVLLLDEPTRNLSPLSAPVVRGILRDFRGSILCVTHDRKLLDEVFDTVYELTPLGLRQIR